MIVFDLRCAAGHVFEGWFGSSDDYEGQRERGLLACPICGAGGIEKAVMAPAVGAKGNTRDAPRATSPASSAPAAPVAMPAGQTPAISPAKMKAMMQALAQAQTEMLARSEHVGRRFADEARAIHLGEADARPIHGQATPQEARALIEEGIEVAPLPFPLRDPATEN